MCYETVVLSNGSYNINSVLSFVKQLNVKRLNYFVLLSRAEVSNFYWLLTITQPSSSNSYVRVTLLPSGAIDSVINLLSSKVVVLYKRRRFINHRRNKTRAFTLIIPPGMCSWYSSPSLNVLTTFRKNVDEAIVHSPCSLLFISINGLELHIIFLGMYGIPTIKQKLENNTFTRERWNLPQALKYSSKFSFFWCWYFPTICTILKGLLQQMCWMGVISTVDKLSAVGKIQVRYVLQITHLKMNYSLVFSRFSLRLNCQ